MNAKPTLNYNLSLIVAAAEAKFGAKPFQQKKRWAKKAEISVPTLEAFLRAENYVKLSTAGKIVAAVGLSVADVAQISNGRKTA